MISNVPYNTALMQPTIKDFTNVFIRNCMANTKYKLNQGGTRSSKTISILQKTIIKAHSDRIHGKLFSVVSENLPHMKRTAFRDFENLMKAYGLWDPNRLNKQDMTYDAGRNQIEFFGVDSEKKVHSAGRDYLYLVEAQNIAYEIAYQLFMRTNDEISMCYNPTHRFWAHTKILDNPDYADMVTFIKSTYLDNRFLSPSIVKDILIRAKIDPNFKTIYIDGEIGSLEGLIYPKFNIVAELPELYEREFFGLDFGFANSYTCLTRIRLFEGQLYIKEEIYERNLLPRDLAQRMTDLGITPEDEIVGDSNAPSIIAELADIYGFNIVGALKGKDSVEFGIAQCKTYPLNVTACSVNGIRELRSYSWSPLRDLSGEFMNKPIKKGDDFTDSFRYPVQTLLGDRHDEIDVD